MDLPKMAIFERTNERVRAYNYKYGRKRRELERD